MGEYLNQVPEILHDHIKAVIKASKLPEDDETMEKIAKGWLDKKQVFEQEIEKQNMEEVDTVGMNDPKGALILTYSGSLLNIGPIMNNNRKVVYKSIGLRTDAPDSAEKEESKLANDINIDNIVEFEIGPVKSTSKVFKIAVLKENLEPVEQEKNLTQVMDQVEELMLGVNKTIMLE